jgi:hypothetical protein
MLDAILVTVVIVLFIASMLGLKLFMQGQGKNLGRNE